MSAATEQECDLMLEALQMHLETIRSRLVSLNDHFQAQADIPVIDPPPPPDTRPLVSVIPEEVKQDPPSKSPSEPRPHQVVRRKESMSRSDISSHTDAAETASRSGARGYKPLSDQLSDWKPLHTYYKHVHLEVLQQHVEQQLDTQRRTEKRWEDKCRRREAKERRARLALKPRMYRSDQNIDNSFLQKVHTSIFYKIVEMEHRMKKKGLLRSKVDHDTFWNTMLSRDGNKPPSPPRLAPPSCNISPVKEEDSEELTNTWAITGLHETGTVPPPPPPDSHPLLTCQTEDILSELQRAVESNRPPKMHALSDILHPDSFRIEEKSQASDVALLEVRSARDKMHMMLAHSKRHELEAQRFMERSDFVDFSSLFSNFCAQLDQLSLDTSSSPPTTVKKVTATKISKSTPSLPPILPPSPSPPTPPPTTSKLADIKEESVSSLTPTGTATTSNQADVNAARHEPVPLCLSEVVSCSLAVKRPTGRSSLWNPLLSFD